MDASRFYRSVDGRCILMNLKGVYATCSGGDCRACTFVIADRLDRLQAEIGAKKSAKKKVDA